MYQDWRKELNWAVIILLTVGLIGFALGQTLLAISFCLVIYLGYFFVQLYRLGNWLQSLDTDRFRPPPEGFGLWGEIFDGIHKLQKETRQANLELQYILARAQNSVAALDIAVVLIDNKDTLEWWNDAAETLLGFRYPQDRRQTATNLIRNPSFSQYFYEEKYNEPLTITSPINSNLMLEIQITLFGEQDKVILVRNITKIHKLELMRKDFVANVSHELRTPITVISGYLETLMENSQFIDGKWHKPLQQMHQQSKRMENIVRDLLMLSRLETKGISLQQSTINLRSFLNEIRNDTFQIFEDLHHTITVECDETMGLTGDRGELYSAISNLVFNAAKYTASGGEIQLRCEAVDDAIEISVVDNGIGIEPQHIPRITERFYRVDVSRSTSTGGTGLGLAIVKHILMRHNAVLEITSTPGKGSCFKCRFPGRITRINESGESKDLQESSMTQLNATHSG